MDCGVEVVGEGRVVDLGNGSVLATITDKSISRGDAILGNESSKSFTDGGSRYTNSFSSSSGNNVAVMGANKTSSPLFESGTTIVSLS